MSKLGERIRALRKGRDLTILVVAKHLGVSPSTVRGWETGHSGPRRDQLNPLARLLGTSADYLLLLTDLPQDAYPVDASHWPSLPVHGPVQAGKAGFISEEPEEGRRLVDPERIKGGTYYYLRVSGDCMYPRIHDGDLVLVRWQERIENGEVGVVVLKGEGAATLKRVYFQGAKVMLKADNPSHPVILAEASDVRIVGLVEETLGRVL